MINGSGFTLRSFLLTLDEEINAFNQSKQFERRRQNFDSSNRSDASVSPIDVAHCFLL